MPRRLWSRTPRPLDEDAAKGPVGIVKAYWRQIVLAMILAAAANTVGYALTSYMPTYLTDAKGYDPSPRYAADHPGTGRHGRRAFR